MLKLRGLGATFSSFSGGGLNGADGAGGGPVSGFGCGASVLDENLTNEMNHRGFPSEESAVAVAFVETKHWSSPGPDFHRFS